MSLLLVLALLEGFFSRFSGFPTSTKTNIAKFQFDQDRGLAWKPAKTDVAFALKILIYLIFICIYLPGIHYYSHKKQTNKQTNTVPAEGHNLDLHVLRELLLTLSLPTQDKHLTVSLIIGRGYCKQNILICQ